MNVESYNPLQKTFLYKPLSYSLTQTENLKSETFIQKESNFLPNTIPNTILSQTPSTSSEKNTNELEKPSKKRKNSEESNELFIFQNKTIEKRKEYNRATAKNSYEKKKKIIEVGQIEHMKLLKFAYSIEMVSKLFQRVYPELSHDLISIKIEEDNENPDLLIEKIKEVCNKILAKASQINDELQQYEKKLNEENNYLFLENQSLMKLLKNQYT